MKSYTRVAALFGASALILSACGAPPEESASGGSDGGSGNSDYTACMASDQGGFDDKSFNESGYNGLKAVEKDGATIKTAESSTEADFDPNLEQLVQQGCDTIYAVGYLFSNHVKTQAEANPDLHYAIIDSTAQDENGETVEVANVKPLLFDTSQASFLAGYVAAGMTESGTVATYGGMKIPSVTIFMDGFADGVAHYNEVHNKDVKVLGWNKDSQDGSFSGDFDDQTKGKALTEGFISQGADIVMPVAGPVGAGSIAAAQEKEGTKIIWVDSDGAETNPQAKDIILTSVMKEIAQSVQDTATEIGEGKFSNEPYIGTLENGGVGLAPFHEFEDQVPDELKKEVEDLRQKIIDGEVEVTSPASPKK